jgi:hypothetical protein
MATTGHINDKRIGAFQLIGGVPTLSTIALASGTKVSWKINDLEYASLVVNGNGYSENLILT